MKTTIKKMDYDKVMALPRPEHKLPQKPNFFWRGLIRLLTVFGMAGTGFFIYYGGQHQGSIPTLVGIYISYGFIMGIGLGTEAGMMAAMFHIFSHSACKSMLFIAASGLYDASGDHKDFRNLRGAGYRSPVAAAAFTVGALSMVGFPFLGGFISKLNFATAAMEVGSIPMILVLITLAISTWLNTIYFLKTVITLYNLDKVVTHIKLYKISVCTVLCRHYCICIDINRC